MVVSAELYAQTRRDGMQRDIVRVDVDGDPNKRARCRRRMPLCVKFDKLVLEAKDDRRRDHIFGSRSDCPAALAGLCRCLDALPGWSG